MNKVKDRMLSRRSFFKAGAVIAAAAALGSIATTTPGELGLLVRQMPDVAVSTANGCTYCVHSHTAAAKARGMTGAQHGELMAVIGMAMQTNGLVTAMQVEVDEAFRV